MTLLKLAEFYVNPEHVEVVRFTRRPTAPGIGAGGDEELVVLTTRSGKEVSSARPEDLAAVRAWCERMANPPRPPQPPPR